MSPLHIPELTGERVVLRRWRRSDLPAIADASSDSYVVGTTSVPEAYSEAEGLAWLQRQEDHVTSETAYPFAVSESADGVALGFMGLFTNPDRCWEAGYWVRPSARGRGIAGEALALATEWALGLEEVSCIELQIEPWNAASCRVAEQAGFALRDRRYEVEHRGTNRDFLVYVRYAINSEAGDTHG